jgi:hypothetical protein
MYRILGADANCASSTSISFRADSDTVRWHPAPISLPADTDGAISAPLISNLAFILLGHDDAGPLIVLSRLPPMAQGPGTAPIHGHDADTFRMTLRGRMRMGRTIDEGEFVFWPSIRRYGASDVAWGPDGGWALVMSADRRGALERMDDTAIEAASEERIRRLAGWVGFTIPESPPQVSGIRTQLDLDSRQGAVKGSFATVDAWPQICEGIRLAVSVIGDHHVGPVLIAAHLDGGFSLGEASFDTEMLTIVVGGRGTIGATEVELGDLVLFPPGAAETVTAASGGLDVVIVLGDRSRLGTPDPEWARGVVDQAGELAASLT